MKGFVCCVYTRVGQEELLFDHEIESVSHE